MAGSLKAFQCYRCGVEFKQEQSLLRHYNSNKHKALEDIQERVEEWQQLDSRTLMDVPVLDEVSPDANDSSWPLETEM